MEIENCWKNIPPFSKTEKGKNGFYGYGYFRKGRSLCNGKVSSRKIKRQIRKMGFDSSEIWNLDYTIMRWLSDTFGGFFRICGNPDNWTEYDLNGKKVEEDYRNNSYYEKIDSFFISRRDSFLNHLRDFLKNASESDKEMIKNFCSPRLRYLLKYNCGHPYDLTFEEWNSEIQEMIDSFDNYTYSEKFIEKFFCLWD